MSPDAGRGARGDRPGDRITVRVQHDGRGGWSVAMPNQRGQVTCETFDDARRVAYLCAAHTRPCELIIHDASHRVLHRELINGHHDPGPSRPAAILTQTTHQGGQ